MASASAMQGRLNTLEALLYVHVCSVVPLQYVSATGGRKAYVAPCSSGAIGC